jgi:hypothetical protein
VRAGLPAWSGVVPGLAGPPPPGRCGSRWRVPPYDEALDATLTADGDQTILVIEVRGMPLDASPFYGVGWQIHAENLAAYLAGRTRGGAQARWEELVPAYQNLAASISLWIGQAVITAASSCCAWS